MKNKKSRIKRKLAIPLLAMATLGFTANSHADAIGVYVQANLGQASASQSKEIKDWEFDKKDKKDTAFKLAVGYKVIDYFAVELQYADLGEAVHKTVVPGSFKAEMVSETQGLGINAVGILPLGDFSLTAKIGAHQLKNKVTVSFDDYVIPGDSGKASKTLKKVSPLVGIGASYNVVAGLDIGLDYERYMNVADKKWKAEGDYSFKHDIDFVSLSLRYSF